MRLSNRKGYAIAAAAHSAAYGAEIPGKFSVQPKIDRCLGSGKGQSG